MQKLVIYAERCTGCRVCELVCALYNEGVNNPMFSRIRITSDYTYRLDSPVVCYQCGNPPCVPPCPVSAITKDPETGVIQIDYETCTACGLCSANCPFGAIPQLEAKVIKCELCDGNPQCVKYCETRALELVDREAAYQNRRLEHGQKFIQAQKESAGLTDT